MGFKDAFSVQQAFLVFVACTPRTTSHWVEPIAMQFDPEAAKHTVHGIALSHPRNTRPQAFCALHLGQPSCNNHSSKRPIQKVNLSRTMSKVSAPPKRSLQLFAFCRLAPSSQKVAWVCSTMLDPPKKKHHGRFPVGAQKGSYNKKTHPVHVDSGACGTRLSSGTCSLRGLSRPRGTAQDELPGRARL